MNRLKAEYTGHIAEPGGYQALANAVVTQATKDYRMSIRHLKTHPGSQTASVMKRECERFFHSNWYSLLTSVDADYILNRIRKEEAA